jgi:hypothetical protein
MKYETGAEELTVGSSGRVSSSGAVGSCTEAPRALFALLFLLAAAFAVALSRSASFAASTDSTLRVSLSRRP